MKKFGLTLFLVTGLILSCVMAFAQAPAADKPVADQPVTDKPADKPAAAPAEEVKVGTTLENLQVAFNGESNAKERYTAFAAKADEEKYLQAARLFRAAAKAEEVHAEHHAKIITALGGNPVADVKKPEVKSTKENLEAALAGETFERAKMYPAFVKKAEEEKQEKAMKTFKGAMAAEGDHAAFFGEALKNLDGMKDLKTEYLVCLVCGHTTINMDLKKCPVCEAPREKFVTIK